MCLQPVYIQIEAIDSERTTSWDERDDIPSGSPQNGSTMATGGTDSLDERLSFTSLDEKVTLGACTVCVESISPSLSDIPHLVTQNELGNLLNMTMFL